MTDPTNPDTRFFIATGFAAFDDADKVLLHDAERVVLGLVLNGTFYINVDKTFFDDFAAHLRAAGMRHTTYHEGMDDDLFAKLLDVPRTDVGGVIWSPAQ
ncbi:MAG: hypothetical protein OXN92_08055 [Gammaproteobacteria bacterium]|nr:hypothetical protein [Gammaproteobacteria bacterium]